MPAEPAEEILARFPGEEPVSLGYIVRISDGDVIGFNPTYDEHGEIIYALSDHFERQITYLDEEAIAAAPKVRTALCDTVHALQQLFDHEDRMQARSEAMRLLAKEARARGKGFSAAERDARIPQPPEVIDLGDLLTTIRPHLPVLVQYLEL